jgi:hypothetical protein
MQLKDALRAAADAALHLDCAAFHEQEVHVAHVAMSVALVLQRFST